MVCVKTALGLGLAQSRHYINVDIIIIDGFHFKQAEKNTGTAWLILDLTRHLTKEVFLLLDVY